MVLNILLFAATFITTLLSGALMSNVDILRHPEQIALGLQFSLPLLAILGVHEMGHYVAGRLHRVDVTLPYFIPFLPIPPNPGTMGAVIKIRSPFPTRNALMDIGAAGPLAGAAVAIPVLLFGLTLSHVRQLSGLGGEHFQLGEPLILKAAIRAVFGVLPVGQDVVLHPVAYAGWIGLLVTMLNLIPSGQLDGGHIAYAMFGGRYSETARLIPYALLLMGLVNPSWFVWAMILFIIGTRHPAPMFDDVPLSRGRKAIGALSLLLFILTFSPNPIS
ncbi:MAG TPA: site-2 protease family protein [Candidatus Deferrimicrobiaceae bacterium]|jgi:membrane-associated protease RseP (regulator of RpoE activity)